MDYNEFSEKIKTKYPEYKDIDNMELAQKMIAKYPEYQEQVSFNIEKPQEQAQQKNIDLTPSGIINNTSQAVADAILTPVEMIKTKETNPVKAYNAVAKRNKEVNKEIKKQTPVLSGARDLGLDLLGYSMLPVAKGGGIANFAKNAVVQGGVPMALESLKRGGNALGGLAGGSLLGAGIQTLPYVGRVAGLVPSAGKLISRTVGRVKPETIERAVKADSKALDLSEKEAQNLLMDTTEAVRNNYKNLIQKRGDTVGNLLEELPEDKTFKAQDLLSNYDGILNSYSLSKNAKLNPARNATQKEISKIEDLLGGNMPDIAKAQNEISPKELYDVNKNISNMIDWDKPGAQLKNDVLEQIYLSNAQKLSKLSPDLAQANKNYADLMDFQKNEGVRRILNNQNNIDTASSALRNYNSTVTKGNTNRNIQDLEDLLVKNGYDPFLGNIDDVNAAMDLLNIRGTGDSWLANLATQMTRPALKAARAYNRSNLPNVVTNIKESLSPLAQRLLTPLAVKGAAPILYGGIQYNDVQ